MDLRKIRYYLSLRKLNSIIILIILFLLLSHAFISVLYFFDIIKTVPNLETTGRRLFLWILLHIIISIYLWIKDKLKRGKHRLYNFIRNDTQIQLISGIAIIILAVSHVISYKIMPVNIRNDMIIIHFFIDNLLFLALFVHLQISIPRVAMSYGFLTKSGSYDEFKFKVRIVLIFIFIILLISEISYYILMGV